MPITLYGLVSSPPCRAVLMIAKELGLNMEFKELDTYDPKKPKPEWFLKMNPNHTIPTLDDNGFHLWESRAIMAYLVHQYGKNDSLYPKEPKQRALVDNMLYFDIGSLYRGICDYLFAPTFENTPVNPQKGEHLQEKVSILNQILQDHPYVAGSKKTIADFTVLQSVASLDAYSYDLKPFPAIQKWYRKLHQELPYYDELMSKGVEELREYIKPGKK